MSLRSSPSLSPPPAARLDRLIAALAAFSRRHAWPVVLLAVALAVVSGAYTVRNLGMNTDTADMISPDLPFRQAGRDFERAFPQFVELLIVVIDGDTPERAEVAARSLARAMAADDGIFASVYRPGGEAFFRRNGLLYLSPDELGVLADNLARVQPLLAALATDPSLRRLFGELETAIGALRDGETPAFDLAAAFDRLAAAAEAQTAGRPYHLSWREVISGKTATPDDRRRLILAQPRLDFGALQPQKAALDAVRAAAARLGLTPDQGIRVRLTGPVALDYEQLESARKGAGVAAPVSFALVALVLFVGLRSMRLVLASLAALIIGLLLTAGFATLAVGELNLVSVAFAVLFIGLGIDFSIHLALRYREIVARGDIDGLASGDKAVAAAAVDGAAVHVGRALVLCAATTAAGFYVFIPTAYRGVAELGLIAGSGMFIALAVNLAVLPAIFALAPLRSARPLTRRWWNRVLDRIGRRRRLIRIGAGVLGIAAAALLPFARFNFNPLDLQNASAESVQTLRDLLADGGGSPWTIDVLAGDLETARKLAARLRALPEVKDARTIADLVPNDQDEKLDEIADMSFFLGPPPQPGSELAPADAPARRAALKAFLTTIDAWLESGAAAPEIAPAARRLAKALHRLDAANAPLDRLERSLLGDFKRQLDELYLALSVSEPITLDSLPETLRARMVAADGRVRVQVLPRDDLDDNAALRRFVDAVRGVAPQAVGAPISILESGDAVVRAFQQALASAVVVTLILLLGLTRRPRDAFLVLVPLALATALTGAASVLLDIPFNFANVIVLPLLFGIGVDSAIHLVLRARAWREGDGHLLETSTARGIVFSGLTTIGSFGSLMLSAHRGTASMGALLAVGVAATLICTLIVLPALLPRRPSLEKEERS